MATISFGNEDNQLIGQVVSVDDPDQQGSLQISVIGKTDLIANADCYWGKLHQGTASAGQNQIGSMPVGPIVGSWVHGFWSDSDMQIPIIMGTVHSAGTLDPSGKTVNGHQAIDTTKASTPKGGRNPPPGKPKDNAFVTRQGKSIKEDDQHPTQSPPVQTDADAKDVTAQAKSNTSYGTNGTTGSITNPIGSILSQISKVDPKNLNAVLPNAVAAFTKMKDLSAFSSTVGVNGLLGQALGAALNAAGLGTAAQAIGTALSATGLSGTSVAALQGAMESIGSTPQFSQTVASVVNPVITQLTGGLQSLISNGGLNNNSFNSLMSEAQGIIQNMGAMASIGANMNNIMSSLDSVLPTLSGAIKAVQSGHLAEAVLDIGIMGTALQKFAMNQAFVKAPDKGKKALAKKAVSTVSSKTAAANVQALPVTPAAKTNIAAIVAYNP